MAVTVVWNDNFNTLPPASGEVASNGPARIQAFKLAVRERAEREHLWSEADTNADHGIHRQGSAMAYWQITAPTLMPDGVASLANDAKSKGRIWFDSDDDHLTPYVYGVDRGSAATNAWLPLGSVPVGSIIAWGQGYYSAGGLTGYVGVLTSANLPPNWKVADGAAPNNTKSPIWNTASRYLPKIDGTRFLLGGVKDPSNGTVMTGGAWNFSHTHTGTMHSHSILPHRHTAGSYFAAFTVSTNTLYLRMGVSASWTTTHRTSLANLVADSTAGVTAGMEIVGLSDYALNVTEGAAPSLDATDVTPPYFKTTYIVRIY